MATFTGSEGFKARCPISQIQRLVVNKTTGGATTHTAGDVYATASGVIGIVMESVTATEDFLVAYNIPMYEIAKDTSDTITAGMVLFYDSANTRVTNVATNLYPICIALENAAASATTVLVHWIGSGLVTYGTLDITY